MGRPEVDLPRHEEEIQHAQERVHPGEADQRKQDVARRHIGRMSDLGPHEPVDHPRLSAELGGPPTGGVGEEREGAGEVLADRDGVVVSATSLI